MPDVLDYGVEQSVLCCIMLDPQRYFEVESTGLRPEHFSLECDGRIYQAIAELCAYGSPVDVATVCDRLGKHLPEVGGREYLLAIMDCEPSAAQASYYARRVLDRAQVRAFEGYLTSCHRMLADGTAPEELMCRAEDALRRVRVGEDYQSQTVAQIAQELYTQMEQHAPPDLAFSGLAAVDSLIHGWRRKTITTITGNTGVGKTSFALQLAHAWSEQGSPCGILSLEMSAEELAARYVTSQGGVPYARMKSHDLREEDWSGLLNVIQSDYARGLHVDDRSDVTESNVGARVREMVYRHGVANVFVDYIQLIPTRGDDRVGGLYRLMPALMDLTKQLNLRLVLLSQVNREQDALGAGAIMHNSNYVLAVERERTRAVASEGRVASAAENTFVDSVDAQIVVRKARDGASGVAAVYYDPCWFFNTAEEAYFAKRRRQNG